MRENRTSGVARGEGVLSGVLPYSTGSFFFRSHQPAKCPSLVDQRLGAPAGLLLEPGFERVGDGGGGGVAVGGFDGHGA